MLTKRGYANHYFNICHGAHGCCSEMKELEATFKHCPEGFSTHTRKLCEPCKAFGELLIDHKDHCSGEACIYCAPAPVVSATIFPPFFLALKDHDQDLLRQAAKHLDSCTLRPCENQFCIPLRQWRVHYSLCAVLNCVICTKFDDIFNIVSSGSDTEIEADETASDYPFDHQDPDLTPPRGNTPNLGTHIIEPTPPANLSRRPPTIIQADHETTLEKMHFDSQQLAADALKVKRIDVWRAIVDSTNIQGWFLKIIDRPIHTVLPAPILPPAPIIPAPVLAPAPVLPAPVLPPAPVIEPHVPARRSIRQRHPFDLNVFSSGDHYTILHNDIMYPAIFTQVITLINGRNVYRFKYPDQSFEDIPANDLNLRVKKSRKRKF